MYRIKLLQLNDGLISSDTGDQFQSIMQCGLMVTETT